MFAPEEIVLLHFGVGLLLPLQSAIWYVFWGANGDPPQGAHCGPATPYGVLRERQEGPGVAL